MDREKLLNTYLQELAMQRALLGDRALSLAAQIAEQKERIEQLEKELGEFRKNSLVHVVK